MEGKRFENNLPTFEEKIQIERYSKFILKQIILQFIKKRNFSTFAKCLIYSLLTHNHQKNVAIH